MKTKLHVVAKIITRADHILVEAHWYGAKLDRPCTGGWEFSLKARALTERLAKAIDAQKVFTGIKIVKDDGGKTYVEAVGHVSGRCANADLCRLGF